MESQSKLLLSISFLLIFGYSFSQENKPRIYTQLLCKKIDNDNKLICKESYIVKKKKFIDHLNYNETVYYIKNGSPIIKLFAVQKYFMARYENNEYSMSLFNNLSDEILYSCYYVNTVNLFDYLLLTLDEFNNPEIYKIISSKVKFIIEKEVEDKYQNYIVGKWKNDTSEENMIFLKNNILFSNEEIDKYWFLTGNSKCESKINEIGLFLSIDSVCYKVQELSAQKLVIISLIDNKIMSFHKIDKDSGR